MSHPLLSERLPESQVERLVGQFLAVLRSDPTLTAAGVLIHGPEGSRELEPPNIPPLDQLPCIRINPDIKIDGAWMEEQAHRFQVSIPIDCIHQGTHYADSFRLIQALGRAIFPIDADRRAIVEAMFQCDPDLGILGTGTLNTVAGDAKPIGADQCARLIPGLFQVTCEFRS